jgi:CheY-like chemotaxis protein
VRSVTGEGTVFRFGLPATGAPVQDAGGHGEAPSGQRGEATSGARFALVVDDMPLVRDALVSMLRSLGWEAAGFGSVEEAAAEGAVPAGIAPGVVLLDFTIPGTSPGENAARLRGRFPGAALLLVSGYAAPAVGGSDAQPDGFLQKPFSAEGLLEAVTAAMEQARGRAGLAEGAVGGGVGGSVNAAAYSPGRR